VQKAVLLADVQLDVRLKQKQVENIET
jgi:hypothetical protein